jgi:hypothetical protein
MASPAARAVRKGPERAGTPGQLSRADRVAVRIGWTLARAHARCSDRVGLAANLGGSDACDQAIADFAATYADRSERDYAGLQSAGEDGRAEATTDI